MSRQPLLATFALLALVVVSTRSAEAGRRSFGGSGSNYQSNGKFGLGLELGAPTGLNAKLFLAPSRALNFGVGWLYDNYYRNGDGINLYIDHLWHPVSLSDNPTFKLPFFIGVGGTFWSFNDNSNRLNNRYSALGVRVPFGLAFDFNNVPLDIYIQLTFVVDVFLGNYADRFGPGFQGNVGIRYWFD